MKHRNYVTRALKARDPRFARILGRLGYDTTQLVSDDSGEPRRAKRPQLDHDHDGKEGGSKSAGGDLAAVRAEYTSVTGKRPFNGWDADTLRAKIAEKRAQG